MAGWHERAGWLNANPYYYFTGCRLGEAVLRRGRQKILFLWFFCQNPASRKKWVAETVSLGGAASGERFRLARLRRELSAETFAERASNSRMTLHRAEKGSPAVAMGTYLRILAVLRLQNDIGLLAQGDKLGRGLQELELRKKKGANMNRDKLEIWLDADFMPEKPWLERWPTTERASGSSTLRPGWIRRIGSILTINKADHVLNLDADDNRPSLDTVLETAAFYDLSKAEANRIVNEVLGVVRTWKTVARQKFKLAAADMALMESAFVI